MWPDDDQWPTLWLGALFNCASAFHNNVSITRNSRIHAAYSNTDERAITVSHSSNFDHQRTINRLTSYVTSTLIRALHTSTNNTTRTSTLHRIILAANVSQSLKIITEEALSAFRGGSGIISGPHWDSLQCGLTPSWNKRKGPPQEKNGT